MSERLDTRLRTLLELKEAKDKANRAADQAKRKHREFEAQLWEEIEEEQGDIPSITVNFPDIGRVTFTRRETTVAAIDDLEQAVESLTAMGLGDEVVKGTPDVRQKVLSEHVRDWLKTGQRLPAGVNFRVSRGVTISKKGKS